MNTPNAQTPEPLRSAGNPQPKDAAKIAAELAGKPEVEAEVLREIIKTLTTEKARLRTALENAHSFIQHVGTEDPEDVETMADIERLSGQITATLAETL